MSLRAFHNDPEVKKFYLTRVRKHAKADEIVKGQYWEDGKGCAVGCTIHSSQHADYEKNLGIPEWLAIVEDRLFEGMSNTKAKKWPALFLSSIKPGVDLEKAKRPFLVAVLKSALKSMKSVKYNKKKFPAVIAAQKQCEAAVKEMIICHQKGLDTLKAAVAAVAVAEVARSVAKSTAASSAEREVAWSAWAAESTEPSARWEARSAAWAAESAAESAESSARSAARSAARSVARSAAWAAAAREKNYNNLADSLIKILKGLK